MKRESDFFLLTLLSFFFLLFVKGQSASTFGLPSGDEQYWRKSLSELGVVNYVLLIDDQNPYLSILPRVISIMGFLDVGTGQYSDIQQDPPVFVSFYLFRIITFLIASACLVSPALLYSRDTLKLNRVQSVLIATLNVLMCKEENLYIFNLGYLLAIPMLVILMGIKGAKTSQVQKPMAISIFLFSIMFFITFLTKSIVVIIFLVFAVISISHRRRYGVFEKGNLIFVGLALASIILLILSEGKSTFMVNSLTQFFYLLSGIPYLFGKILFPVGSLFDFYTRSMNLDLLTGVFKLATFCLGGGFLILIWSKKTRVENISKFKKSVKFPKLPGDDAILYGLIVVNLAVLNFSSYSTWFYDGWLIGPDWLLFTRHTTIAEFAALLLIVQHTFSFDGVSQIRTRYQVLNSRKRNIGLSELSLLVLLVQYFLLAMKF